MSKMMTRRKRTVYAKMGREHWQSQIGMNSVADLPVAPISSLLLQLKTEVQPKEHHDQVNDQTTLGG